MSLKSPKQRFSSSTKRYRMLKTLRHIVNWKCRHLLREERTVVRKCWISFVKALHELLTSGNQWRTQLHWLLIQHLLVHILSSVQWVFEHFTGRSLIFIIRLKGIIHSHLNPWSVKSFLESSSTFLRTPPRISMSCLAIQSVSKSIGTMILSSWQLGQMVRLVFPLLMPRCANWNRKVGYIIWGGILSLAFSHVAIFGNTGRQGRKCSIETLSTLIGPSTMQIGSGSRQAVSFINTSVSTHQFPFTRNMTERANTFASTVLN